ERCKPDPLSENGRSQTQLDVQDDGRVASGRSRSDTTPHLLTRLGGRRRVDCPVTDGVMNHVDARTQLVATITAHRVWTATVEPLIRRHVTDVLSLKLDFAGQNRAASHAPRKHGPASDRM